MPTSNDKQTLVVLGANSFSGQDFVDLVLDDPRYRVIGISRSVERPTFLKYRENPGRDYRFFQLDLNEQMPELLRLLDSERPELIVNFAAQSEVAPSWETPEDWFQTNCVALAQLINHLRRQDYVRRYLHISSPEVYGTCVGRILEDAPLRPSTPYAASKAAADLLLTTFYKQFQFPLVTVRATNVYGPRQQLFKIIPRTILYSRLGRRIPLHGGGQAVKSFIHIRDVSRGEKAILERGEIGALYHLSPDRGISVREVVTAIASQMGRQLEDIVDIVAERPGQDAAYVIDSSRARNELGWRPEISLEAGLQEVIEWVDRHWDVLSQLPLEYQHRK